MKKSWALLLTSAMLATGWTAQGEAVVIMLDNNGVSFTNRQPIQAVVVDANGNNFQQTVYYDASLGGVDLNTNWAGANASIYFPTLNTGYIWYNGYWVNPEGYYWNGGNRYYVGPAWNTFWTGYWQGHNHWNGDWHHGDWHGGDWHGENWKGNRDDWRVNGDHRRDDWRVDGNRRLDGDRREDNWRVDGDRRENNRRNDGDRGGDYLRDDGNRRGGDRIDGNRGGGGERGGERFDGNRGGERRGDRIDGNRGGERGGGERQGRDRR